jgi:GNAT superfamily N-acetyltransferase
LARFDELEAIRDIEVAACRAFAEIGMVEIAEDAPWPVEALEEYRAHGRAWVATDSEGRPIAYILADILDGNAHIEQVSVHPDSSHRGIGRALIDHVAEWAGARGLDALTLTTFANVAWNAPYYVRCGFETMEPNDLGPDLLRVRAEETTQGLDRYERVVMRRFVQRQ